MPAGAGQPSGGDGGRSTGRIGAASVSLPAGGGSIRGIDETFSTVSSTGTAELTVPLFVTSSRGEVTPELGVTYDSGSGNGIFGLGWRLALPSVTRQTDRGVPRYEDGEDTDTFLCNGAELVPVLADVGGTLVHRPRRVGDHDVEGFRPRVEGAFVRIERWTRRSDGDVHWRTVSRSNVTSVLGRSVDRRIADPADARRVYSWLLEERRDGFGNVAAYEYVAEDAAGVDRGAASERGRVTAPYANRYPKRVLYGNRAPGVTGDWCFQVVFDYGDHDPDDPGVAADRPWPLRADAFSTFRPGFELRTQRLCRRVLLFHRFPRLGPAPALVRSTSFSYADDPVATLLTEVTARGHTRPPGGGPLEAESLPPARFGYTAAGLDLTVRGLDATSAEGAPGGLTDGHALVDLDGDALPGILSQADGAWYYKPNLGSARFGPPEPVPTTPSFAGAGRPAQLLDLTGDGRPDVVTLAPGLAGYAARTDGDWAPLRPFRTVPAVDWTDPGLRLVDLTGDGRPDLLHDRHDGLAWHESLGREGFGPEHRVPSPLDDDGRPGVVVGGGREALFLADMNGDGLPDLVRVARTEVAYWPSLGRGRFGPRVVMDGAPVLDLPGRFDPSRVRLADVDGSGVADVLRCDDRGVSLWPNHAGSGLGPEVRIAEFPADVPPADVTVADLLGSGTAVVVWSSPLPADRAAPLRYVDPLGGVKPRLLERVDNTMGRTARYTYAPSTRFWAADRDAGRPWATNLPFPVHVLERSEVDDAVAGTSTVTRYAYHHGHWDPVDREFRGFGCVEQWDAERFDRAVAAEGGGEPVDDDLVVAPVRSVTWFHTGWTGAESLSRQFADEYYRGDPDAARLGDSVVEGTWRPEEERAAHRALKGSILRQETYADDGTDRAAHPYLVTERTYTLRVHQRGDGHHHAVVSVHPRAGLDHHYERDPADPRVHQELTLAVDEHGLVTRTFEVNHPRRAGPGVVVAPEQAAVHARLVEHDLAVVDDDGGYRVGAPVESRGYEVLGLDPAGGVLDVDDARELLDGVPRLPFAAAAPAAGVALRLIEAVRTRYAADDGVTALGPGDLTANALVHEELALAFPDGLVASVFGADVDDALLLDEGRYVHADGAWWVPSGRQVYDPGRFYLRTGYVDPFGQPQLITYDADALVPVRLDDALGNVVTVDYDWRHVAPAVVTDPNGNRKAARMDALGRVTAVALMGKEGEVDPQRRGDTLDEPTQRYAYRTAEWAGRRRPNAVDVASREEHGVDRWVESTTYHDGSGRVVQRKARAEPGPAPLRDAAGVLRRTPGGDLVVGPTDDRWVGTGRTVFDRKGNPVREFEPFFSSTREYEADGDLVEWGVSSTMRYDPIGRLVRADHPDGTFTRVELHPWERVEWDESDTSAESAWAAERAALPATDPAHRAGALAAAHAGTPLRRLLDPLGRTFLSSMDNGTRGTVVYRVRYNGRDDPVEAVDGRGNTIMVADWGALSQKLRIRRHDAGERRLLVNVADNAVRQWDERGHVLRSVYDALQRRTHLHLVAPGRPERLVERVVYGESHPAPAARNLRQQIHLVFDGAGLVDSEEFDFKGNLLRATRRFARDHREDPDWAPVAAAATPQAAVTAAGPMLDAERWTSSTVYDALNRAVRSTTPDGSERRSTYNEAALLERVDVRVRGAASWTVLASDLDHDAKGQRLSTTFGNGLRTTYAYEPATLQLAELRTVRGAVALQHLSYTYDAVGNVVEVRDDAQPTSFFANGVAEPHQQFEHDALYRLVTATGRERLAGQVDAAAVAPLTLPHPNDGQAVRRYTESYDYDAAGNLLEVRHTAAGGSWTRRYRYGAASNRLEATSLPGDADGTFSAAYSYDAHGNTTSMPHLPALRWDHADRLREVDLGGGRRAWYSYDSLGGRVRKVVEHGGSPVEERLALGDLEVWRHRSGGVVDAARETLHVGESGNRVALVETELVRDGVAVAPPQPRIRFQHGNHLGSAVLETDEAGLPITYEEYFPYGATSYFAARSQLEGDLKRYRYVGRERDEETGLAHHGARYLAPWLGRFTSFDPVETIVAGKSGDTNGYAYGNDNPVVLADPNGTWSWGKVLGFAVAVGVGIAVTALTGGIAGPIVAGALGGLAGGVLGEVTEQLVDHGKIVDTNRIIAAGVGGALMGGLFAGAGQLVARAVARPAVSSAIGRALSSASGQAVLRAAYAVARSPVGAAGRAVTAGARRAITPLEQAGEAAGRRMGGRFAENAARQQAGREAAERAVADAARPVNRGVRASMEGEVNGQPMSAGTRSGEFRPNATTPDNRRSIVTPNGEAPPPPNPPPPLQAIDTPGADGRVIPREHCAEIKLFGFTINQTTSSATGNLTVASGQPFCPSCSANIWGFRSARPGISVRVGPADVPTGGAAGALTPQLVLPNDDPNRPPPPANIIELSLPF